MKFYGYANRAIEYLFYSLFLLVPLVFTGNTSELFEFNKMWLTFGITIAIGFFWFSKMIIARQIIFRRTILDIPILLFLISQIVSTVISIDPHVSLWGYYSRWNGGLLSIISYIFLFYAFISNLGAGGGSGRDPDKYLSSESSRSTGGRENERQDPRTRIVKNSLIVSMISGFLVILWALPSHFGHDPTCLLFRGAFDVSCWTADFQPRARIFGPLGQPDWLAGYLGVLLPIAGAFIIQTLRQTKKLSDPRLLFYASCFLLFYLSLLYTGSRSGIASSIVSLLIFFGGYIFLNRKNLDVIKSKFILGVISIMLIISFFAGVQLPVVSKISFNEFKKVLAKPSVSQSSPIETSNKQPAISSQESGGSSSFAIRKIVWRGAISAWLANPVFGTGVETFAFAYYKYRPIEHNRLSEWNFLYNKAHNEYLNYLTTTGAFGLLTYLSFIGLFMLIAVVNIFKIKINLLPFLNSKEIWDHKDPLLLSLFASFISILMINFFGFSVVILNIYLLLIPAFVLILLNLIVRKKTEENISSNISYSMWSGISILALISLFMIWLLVKYWIADTKYALGYNYNRVREFQTAYPLLHDAVNLRQEPVFLDEMAVNDAFIATGLILQNSTESAQIISNLTNEALLTSEKLVKEYPHNVVFSKSRVRILYTLSSVNKDYLPETLKAIKKTEVLAPTDASVLYNLGVIYDQNNETDKAIETLEKVVAYKPDYRDARYALALFYHDSGNLSYHQKAIDQLKYILEKINPEDPQSKESLTLWEKER